MAVPMASSAKVVTFGGSKRRVVSFRVAGVALCDIPTCFTTCRRRFAFTLHILHFTLRTLHYTLHTPHFTLHTLHFTLRTLHYTPHLTLFTLHFTIYTPHSTLYTTLYSPHFTVHTLQSALYTLHFTLHPLHCTRYTPHCTLHIPHFTLWTPHSALHPLHSTQHTMRATSENPLSPGFVSRYLMCLPVLVWRLPLWLYLCFAAEFNPSDEFFVLVLPCASTCTLRLGHTAGVVCFLESRPL